MFYFVYTDTHTMIDHHKTLFLFLGTIGISIIGWLVANLDNLGVLFWVAFFLGIAINASALLQFMKYRNRVKSMDIGVE